jgi:dienelactone hydrolase
LPVLVYNHGSQRDPSPEFFGDLGRWFQSRGFMAFFPYRRGASGSEGPHWEDVAEKSSRKQRQHTIIDRLDAQSDDVLAAIEWIRAQPDADATHVAVAGCSFGGIETVLRRRKNALGKIERRL